MDALETLMSQNSISSIVFILILAAVAVKFLGELLAYFSDKLNNYFNIKREDGDFKKETQKQLTELKEESRERTISLDKQRKEDEAFRMNIQNTLTELLENQDKMIKHQHLLAEKIDNNTNQVSLLRERMQDSTRIYIIDKYHHFKTIGAIDTMSLEDLERRFMYYKEAGGDTFIDGLIEEIRKLPVISLEQLLETKESDNDSGAT